MIWIEFLGPSGVGKSYWYQKLIERYPQCEINSLVLRRIRHSSSYNNSPLYIKFFFLLYQLGLPKLKTFTRQTLLNYYGRRFEKKDKNIYTEADNKSIRVYLNTMLQSKDLPIVCLKKVEYFADQLRKFKFYSFYLRENDVYIAEDGLLHLSPVYLSEFKADLFLIFKKDLSEIIDQRLNRAVNKPSTFTEFLLSPQDLKDNIRCYFAKYQEKVELIKQNHTKLYLEIDVEKEDVVQIIHEKILQIKTKGLSNGQPIAINI